MATETLEAKKPDAEAPAKEEDGFGDSVKETVSEKAVSRESDGEKKDEKDEAREGEGEEKEEEEDGESEEEKKDKKGSGRKKSADKEPVTPVSDRPTRERKKVERYSLPTPSRSSASKSVSIEKGRGTRLREIPNVAYKLSKRKPDDNLLLLHTILYGKKAKAQMLKRNIGQFSGFVWPEKEEEKQRARVKEKLEKCIKEKLIDFCDVLDIPVNKSNVKKEELSVKVLEFLEYPKATRDILLADREKQVKKRKGTPKSENSGEPSDVATKRKRQSKTSGKKQNQPSESEGKDDGDKDSEGTNDYHEDNAPPKEESDDEDTQTEDEKDEAEEKKLSEKQSSSKKTVKESSGTKHKDIAASAEDVPGKSSEVGQSSKHITKSVTSPTKKQKVEEGQKDQNHSSKERGKKRQSKPQAKESKNQGKEKAGKKGKAEPTREEMHAVVAKILKEVDFNTATLSDILRKLGGHFGVDLMHRKAEVKDIITEAINEMTDDEDDEEGEENTEAGGDKEKEG